MKKHPDGSITELPRIKLHPKQQSSLLDATSMAKEEADLLAKCIDNYLKKPTNKK